MIEPHEPRTPTADGPRGGEAATQPFVGIDETSVEQVAEGRMPARRVEVADDQRRRAWSGRTITDVREVLLPLPEVVSVESRPRVHRQQADPSDSELETRLPAHR